MSRRAAAGLALALSIVACGGEKLTHVPAPGTHTETFEQNAASKIDLLWVVDNSGSMADKQAKLAASFQRFIDTFARGAIDYRIAVTTTDVFAQTPGSSGTFYGTPAIIKPTDDDPLAEFQVNIKVGTGGSGNEEGLAAAKMALDLVNQQNQPVLAARQQCILGCANQQSSKTCVTACQTNNEPDFLRPDAYLYVVFVSDDEDHSPDEPLFYGRYLETVKGIGNEVAVSASAIVGDPAGPTCDARPGIRYSGVVAYTGGILGSICDATFDQNLSRLAQDAVGLQRHFLLGSYPQLTSMQLQIAYRCDTPLDQLAVCDSVANNCGGTDPSQLGLMCTPKASTIVPIDAAHPEGYTVGWSYQCSDNSITFHKDATGDAVPGLRSELQVTYLTSKDLQCAQ